MKGDKPLIRFVIGLPGGYLCAKSSGDGSINKGKGQRNRIHYTTHRAAKREAAKHKGGFVLPIVVGVIVKPMAPMREIVLHGSDVSKLQGFVL